MNIFDAFGPIGSLIGGIGNTVGGLISSSNNKKIAREQIAAQQTENEKNRQFNSAEAALARNFASDQIDLQYNRVLQQNEYNSPLSQIQRLREAGLNPNLAYGNLNSGLQMSGGTSASGPAASSSGSVGVGLPDTSGLGNLGTGLLQASKTAAEIDLMKAQANNLNSNTKGQDIENDYKSQILQGQIDLNGVIIDNTRSNTDLSRKGLEVADAQIVSMTKQADLTAEQWFDAFQHNQLKWFTQNEDGSVRQQVNPDYLQSVYSEWRKIIADADISEQTASAIFSVYMSQIANNLAQASDANARAIGQQIYNSFNRMLYSDSNTRYFVDNIRNEVEFKNNILRIHSENYWKTLMAGGVLPAIGGIATALLK